MIGDILQPTHLLFVLVIALLVLGPKRLPEVGRSLGRGLRDFRTALSGEEHDGHDDVLPRPAAAAADPAPEQETHDEAPAQVHAEPAEPVPAAHADTIPAAHVEAIPAAHVEAIPAEHAEPVPERAEHVG